MTKNSFEALASVLQALQTLKIPYMLVGSFSSNYYSYAPKNCYHDRWCNGDVQMARKEEHPG